MFILSSPKDQVSSFIVKMPFLIKLKVNIQIYIKIAMLWQQN